MKHCSLVVVLLFIYIFDSNVFAQSAVSTNVDQTISHMTLEERVGQLFLIGVNGLDFNSVNAQKLRTLRPGGIIFFGRNIKSAEQISRFTFDFQEAALSLNMPPLFTAVDQEGGSVTRLKHWPPIPSAAAVGRAGDLDLAFKMSLFAGQILKTLGFNMNLAPVLDLSDPLEKSFIGSRSYGDDPNQVASFGAAVTTGFGAAGVVTVAKHFPGHGGAAADSHLGLPVVRRSMSYLKSSDLVPFQVLSRHERLPGLMVAHIAFPLIETTSLPVTYSKVFLSQYLRSELHYSGLIMTDDLEMLGAQGIKDPGERALRAIQAGADIIMVAWNPASQKRAYAGLVNAVKTGRLSEDRLNQSVRRILSSKASLHLDQVNTRPTKKELEVLVYHRELQSVIDRVVTKNLIFSSADEWARLLSRDREVLLISSDLRFNNSFQNALSNRRLRTYYVDKNVTSEQLRNELRQYPKHYDFIYFAGSALSLKLLSGLSRFDRSRLYLITTELPYMVPSAADYKSVFYSYTKHPNLGGLFYQSLAQAKARAYNQTRTPANQESYGSKNHQ